MSQEALGASKNEALENMPNDFRNALDEFRENWQRELKEQKDNPEKPSGKPKTTEEQAESLFRRAVELEQKGKVYDALPLYKKAVQMMPDIEFKFYENQKKNNLGDPLKSHSNEVKVRNENDTLNEVNQNDFIDNLTFKFREDLCDEAYNGKMFLSSRDSGVITTEKHISDLPPEIINYILRWVISSQLDMRSLEQCANVCKGFYLMARDEKVWRLACKKVWGHNIGTLSDGNDNDEEVEKNTTPLYYTWRQMFLNRERLHFHGCYISKTTYLRMGENSFQDQFYRPIQLVEYYRYIRFLPDGKVIMMTNADEPAIGVAKLKNPHNLRNNDVVHYGYYRLFGSTVTLIMHKHQNQKSYTGGTAQYAKNRRGSMASIDTRTTKYIIEFRIASSKKRKFVQLIWQHYSLELTTNKLESSTVFDLTPAKYPPLWFSSVQSYHSQTEAPLA